MAVVDRGLEYVGLEQVTGPLIFVEAVRDVGYGEVAEVADAQGNLRLGTVLEVSDKRAVVQVLEGTSGLAGSSTRVRFLGKSLRLPVSRAMLGRVFDGIGRPADGGPMPLGGDDRDINGQPINPFSREYPRDFIQTGISAIDGMNTLVRGQKLPIFSGNGLPHDRIAAQITRQARLLDEDVQFAIVFGAMGIKHDVAHFFTRSFEESGVLGNVALFLSLASAPSIERLLTPRSALTLAEHLAFDCGLHVLVLLTDMTNYCESLREIGTARGEIPARKGYPGYLYSDLASIYERAGRVKGSPGSITQVAILTMPSDDISHPVPDLTGYITEGQIVLERDLFQRGIYPPIAGLPSLSRLMKDGIGEGRTRDDHAPLASQLFAAYAVVKRVRGLAAVIGEEELSPLDKQYMEFGHAFETRYLSQGEDENRTIQQTLDIGWQVLSMLPRSELYRISDGLLDLHYKPPEVAEVVERKETEAREADTVERHEVVPGEPLKESYPVPKLEVPPTKSSLLTLERSLEFAQEGYDLLEQKRQILVMELMSRLEAAKRAQSDVDDAMAGALAVFREAALRSGTEALAREALGIVRQHKLDYRGRPVMGIDLPTVTAEHEAVKPEFSTAAGSALSDEVMQRFSKSLDAIARLAEIENAVLRLATEVRKTQRRVNALDKVFIPDYKETISYIEDVLEEREREQFVIMKMAKGQV